MNGKGTKGTGRGRVKATPARREMEPQSDEKSEDDDEAARMAAEMRQAIRGGGPLPKNSEDEDEGSCANSDVDEESVEGKEEGRQDVEGEDSAEGSEVEDGEDNSSEEDEDEDDEEEKDRLRNKLTEIPFGQILEMRKDGTTLDKGRQAKDIKEKEKRNKNAPAEMSSKKPVIPAKPSPSSPPLPPSLPSPPSEEREPDSSILSAPGPPWI